MLAQSLVEYGALESLAAAMDKLAYSTRSWIRDASPETWLIVGGIALAVLWLWNRRTA